MTRKTFSENEVMDGQGAWQKTPAAKPKVQAEHGGAESGAKKDIRRNGEKVIRTTERSFNLTDEGSTAGRRSNKDRTASRRS